MLSRISVSLFRRSSARYSTLVEGTVCVRKGTTTTPPVVPRRAMTTTTALRAATTGQPQQQSGRRFASSHDDFAPQRTVVDDGEDEAITMIKQHVTDNPVMVYMKGTPSQPMCTLLVFVLLLLLLFGVFVLFSICMNIPIQWIEFLTWIIFLFFLFPFPSPFLLDDDCSLVYM